MSLVWTGLPSERYACDRTDQAKPKTVVSLFRTPCETIYTKKHCMKVGVIDTPQPPLIDSPSTLGWGSIHDHPPVLMGMSLSTKAVPGPVTDLRTVVRTVALIRTYAAQKTPKTVFAVAQTVAYRSKHAPTHPTPLSGLAVASSKYYAWTSDLFPGPSWLAQRP